MTELEQHIYDSVKDRLPELLEKVRGLEGLKGIAIGVPFYCDGVIDTLTYTRSEDRFTHIDYSKGVKNGMSIGGLMSDYTGYFDQEDIKYFSFEI